VAVTRLDPWFDSYAERTHGMSASVIRALFSVASRPEVVSLAGGMPFVQALPLDALADTVQRLVRDRGASALQYGSGQGDPHLREQILDVVSKVGITCHPDDIVVTCGSQMALDLVTRVFCDPGDVVLVEAPSYVGALGVFASYQCEVRHVAMDDEGLSPDALRSALAELAAEGRRAKLLYTIPSFQNPSGVTQSRDRRRTILQIAQHAGLLVLEDDPYGLLGFEGEPPTALRAWDEQSVIYLGSFSKTIAAGLRVGWAIAPHGVRERLVLAAESAVLCPSNFAQLTVSEYLATQPWQEQIKSFVELYRERRDALVQGLQATMPMGTSWTVPQGGFYSWVTLPDGLNATAMLPRAISGRVAYVPGSGFFADGQGAQQLRLSYCYPEPERISEGVRRLAAVVDEELALQATFGSAAHGSPAEAPKRGLAVPGPEIG
jgi:2-aminoadipate transaminase